MATLLPLRRRAALRVAVSGAAAAAGADGNGRVWRGALPELRRRVRVEVVPEGARPTRRPDVWLADHRPLPAAEGAPLVRVLHEASWVREDFRAVLTDVELTWADDAIGHAAATATRLLLPTHAGVAEVCARTGFAPTACDVVAYGHDPRLAARAGAAAGRRLVVAAAAKDAAAAGAGAPAGERPFVLFCGQAHPKKQLGVLRAAMEELADLGVALVVVAAPSHRPDTAAALAAAVAPLAGDVPVIDLTTAAAAEVHRLDDAALADVMAAATVLALPSLGEGFGLPVLEAMACGCPAVVSDRGALPELVGAAGTVCAPEPGALAAALRPCFTDAAHRAAAAAAARERARPLTWAATADGWAAALQRAASTGPDRAAPPHSNDRFTPVGDVNRSFDARVARRDAASTGPR